MSDVNETHPPAEEDWEASAALLQRAAGKLTRLGAVATDGPWIAAPVRSPRSQVTSAVYTLAGPPGTEVVGSTRRKGGIIRAEDAEWIAAMSPAVYATLAAVLTGTAERHRPVSEPTGGGDFMVTCAGCRRDADEPSMCPDTTAAIALARAVLAYELRKPERVVATALLPAGASS